MLSQGGNTICFATFPMLMADICWSKRRAWLMAPKINTPLCLCQKINPGGSSICEWLYKNTASGGSNILLTIRIPEHI